MAESSKPKDHIVAYVPGSEDQQEKQKAELQVVWSHQLKDSEFVSDWQEAEKELKGGVIMAVTDLTVLSRDPEEWAKRAIVFIKTGAILEPNNEKHRTWWKDYLAGNPRNTLRMGGEDRVLFGLEKRYSELLQEEDTKREQGKQ